MYIKRSCVLQCIPHSIGSCYAVHTYTYYNGIRLGRRGRLLRGDSHGQEGGAALEGIVRYGHQGGGQEHTTQIRVIYNNNNTIEELKIL